MPTQRLDRFDSQKGLDRGRPLWIEALWYAAKVLFFLTPVPWPSELKAQLLRAFGAEVGSDVVIKPRVSIHLPWKLKIGDHCWIGEEVCILNFEPVTIGERSCISQRAFLCTGNHDYRDEAFSYRNAPIRIGAGAWVGAQCFVAPGTVIGDGTVVAAGSVACGELKPNTLYKGNPAAPTGPRWKDA